MQTAKLDKIVKHIYDINDINSYRENIIKCQIKDILGSDFDAAQDVKNEIGLVQ